MAEEEKYSLQEAQEEAEKLQQKIGSGEAKDYQEAEEQVDQETKEAEQQVFRLAMKGDIRGALHFRDEHQLKISDSDIAQSLIKAGKGDLVVYCLSDFQGLDHKYIAEKLIGAGMVWAVLDNIERFAGLDISVLSRLPFSHYSYDHYLESQDEESITPEHLKLKEILEQTCLLGNELPEGVLQRDNWNAEELAKEAFPNIQDAAPASELLELGFSPLQLLRYADRDNLSRHDAFLASADIAALFKKIRPIS